MNRMLFIGIVPMLGATLAAQTQPPILPPPSAPLVAAPQPGTSWEIKVESPPVQPTSPRTTEKSLAPRCPVSILTRCGTNVSIITVSWSDGTKTDGYVIDNCFLLRSPDTGKVVSVPTQDGDPLAIFTRGYQGTTWIAPGTYRDAAFLEQQPAYFFSGEFPARGSGDTASSEKFEAWIAAESRIPLRLRLGQLVYLYGPIQKSAANRLEIPNDVDDYIHKAALQQGALNILHRRTLQQNQE